jgi:hypothetical protein
MADTLSGDGDSESSFPSSPLELVLAGCLGDAAIGFGRQLDAFSKSLLKVPATSFPLADSSFASAVVSSRTSSSVAVAGSPSADASLLLGASSSSFAPMNPQQSSIIVEYTKRLVELLQVCRESFLTNHDWSVLGAEAAAAAGAEVPAASVSLPRASLVVSVPFILSSIIEPLLDACKESTEVCAWPAFNKLVGASSSAYKRLAYKRLTNAPINQPTNQSINQSINENECSIKGRLDKSDAATLMVNTAHSLRSSLEPFASQWPSEDVRATCSSFFSGMVPSEPASGAVSRWVGRLADEGAKWLSVLVEEEASRVLEQSRLKVRLERAAAAKATTDDNRRMLSDTAGLEASEVEAVMRSFYASLFALVMPSFEKLGASICVHPSIGDLSL